MQLMLNKQEIEEMLKNQLNEVCNTTTFDYKTFGTTIENNITNILKPYLKDKYSLKDENIIVAKDKNEFPDLKVIDNNVKIAIEYKSAINTKNPENDMGTFNSWENKLNDYRDNIYYVFLKYKDKNGHIEIENIYFNKVYTFIGTNSNGIIKYREKDGNLRPKKWQEFDDDINYWKSFDEFKKALFEGERYRSYSIIKKKIPFLSTEQKIEIIEYIKKLLK